MSGGNRVRDQRTGARSLEWLNSSRAARHPATEAMEPLRVYVDGQHKEVRRSVLSSAFKMAKLFAQIAGPRTYFVERMLAFGLSSLCLVVDGVVETRPDGLPLLLDRATVIG
jgi:hypothetical protein